MSKTIEERANAVGRELFHCGECTRDPLCNRNLGEPDGPWFDPFCEVKEYEQGYIRGATDQKAIDDEEYRKDMRYVGVKQEELIDRVIDTTIQYLEERLIDVVLVGEDRQEGTWGYRILGERIKDEVKKRL